MNTLTDNQRDILNAAEGIFDAQVTSGGGTTEGAFERASIRINGKVNWSQDWPALCGYLTRYAQKGTEEPLMQATAYYPDGSSKTFATFDLAAESGTKRIVSGGEVFLLLFGGWVGI